MREGILVLKEGSGDCITASSTPTRKHVCLAAELRVRAS